MKYTETCSCGASFTFEGWRGMATAFVTHWRKNHVHDLPPAALPRSDESSATPDPITKKPS